MDGSTRGGSFYDDADVFERYRQHREWTNNPNRTLEQPAFVAELGNVGGARVLDLGCGDGETGAMLLAAGCASYLGIDGSERMVAAANTRLAGGRGVVRRGDLEELAVAEAAFDLIVSRMAFHYVADLATLMQRCAACLVAGGRLIFTVTHPVITSHDARRSAEEPRQDWPVDRYFAEGPRPQRWLGGDTVWHHRTIESYIAALGAARLTLTNLRECPPRPGAFDDPEEFERRRRIPLMLLLAARRAE